MVFPLRFGTDRLTSSSQASKKKPKKRLLYRKTNLALQFPSCPLDATSTLRDGAYSINCQQAPAARLAEKPTGYGAGIPPCYAAAAGRA